MGLPALLDSLLRDPTPRTYAQLLTLSSEDGIARALADGRITRVMPDCFASPTHAASPFTRVRSALQASPTAALYGTSALAAWGAWTPDARVSIAAPWEERPRGPRWLRTRRFVTMPECVTIGGLRTVSPAEAVLGAHEHLPPGERAEAVYAPVRLGVVSPSELADALTARARIRARGELASRIAAAREGRESFLEEEGARCVLIGPAFADLIPQHLISVQRQMFRLDNFHPSLLIDFEFDGAGTHGTPEAHRKDARRDLLLASIGIQTVRFTYPDTMSRPDWCRERALEVMAMRREQVVVPDQA